MFFSNIGIYVFHEISVARRIHNNFYALSITDGSICFVTTFDMIIIIESFSIDQGGGVMFIFRSEKTKKIKQFRLKDPMQSLNTRNE